MTNAPQPLGHYELLDKLGVGGMGTVWRARDLRDESIVAVKVLHPHLAADPDYTRRFEREVRIAQELDSPHVVKVLDAGRDGDTSYIVMEFVPGRTLAQEVQAEGSLDVERAVAIAAQVAQALDAAHAKGIVHRDVSPQNVIIASDGTVKLTDFGVARDLAATAITGTQALMGKPEYIAPEVLTSRGGTPDTRADIYALGIVLYQMLAGTVPFHGETPYGVLMAQINDPLPDITELRPEVPAWLVSVLTRCLEKDPSLRFQEPLALVRALQVRHVLTTITPRPTETMVSRPEREQTPTVLGDRGPPMTPPPLVPAGKGARRPWWLLAGASGGLVLALGLLAFVMLGGGGGDDQVTVESKTSGGGNLKAPVLAPAVTAPATATRAPTPRPPLPTVVPSRVCPTAAPANDAEVFKGCRVFEAKLDGTSSSFQVPRFFGKCSSTSGPQPNVSPELSDARFFPGILELSVLGQWGQTNLNLNTPPRATFVAEYDLQFKPGSENEVMFTLRSQGQFAMILYIAPRSETIYLAFWDSTTRLMADVTARVSVPNVKSGRRLTLTMAVGANRYTAFVDGRQVLDLNDGRLTASQKPIIHTQSCAGYEGLGTVQILGARVYELGGQ